MRSPSFFFSSASLCRTFISFSYSSSVRKLKSNIFPAIFFSSAEAMTHQELIQPRLPQCHGQPPCSLPWCAEQDTAGGKGLHNSMAWVEVALAPGLALPGSSLARFSALHAFPCQENSLSKIMLLRFSSGTVTAIGKPTSIKQASTGRSELAARLSCLNRHESSSHHQQPQHLWHALSSAGKSASVEFKHPCKEITPRCLL